MAESVTKPKGEEFFLDVDFAHIVSSLNANALEDVEWSLSEDGDNHTLTGALKAPATAATAA